MKIDDLLRNRPEWLKDEGPRVNIAMSTRIRLARNIEGHIYFNRADDVQRRKVLEKVMETFGRSSFLKGAAIIRMKDIVPLDRMFLRERHLISREHTEDVTYKGFAVDEREIVSAMINEEDHLRLQVIRPGFAIMEAWRIMEEIDNDMARYLPFDYSSKFGYLTACPTNTGTGLRASVMLHLSALVMTGQIEAVLEAVSKVGLTVRGFYGEGTQALGDFFQISNQVTLGHSEMDILDNLERIISKIIGREETTRKELVNKQGPELADRVYRSYGTLENARIITSDETVRLLSAVRLGADTGVIKNIEQSDIDEMLLISQPAHLQKITGVEMGQYERDIKRADLIIGKFKSISDK